MRELERRRAEAEGRTPRPRSGDPDDPGPDDDEPDAPDDRRRHGRRTARRRHDDEAAGAGSDEPTPIHPPRRRTRAQGRPAAGGAAARPRPHSRWAAPTTAPAASPCGRSCAASGWWPSSSSWSPSSSCSPAPASTSGPTRSGTRASASTASSGPASAPRSACSSAPCWSPSSSCSSTCGSPGASRPRPIPSKPGRLRQMADRLTEAQRQAERARTHGGGPGRPVGGPFPGRAPGRRARLRVRPGRHAGPRADREVGHRRRRDGARHRRSRAPCPAPGTRAAVDQPRAVLARPSRGRPGVRPRHQLLPVRPAVPPLRPVAAQRPAARVAAGGRRPVPASQATAGGEVFITRVRVHLAVIAGLYLLSVAFGYQLDKYELVYSTPGVATGVSFTDANARFMAYDVLTFLSGIAGRAAHRRGVHPLALAARPRRDRVVLRVARPRAPVPGGHPAAHGRPQPYAQEEPYIANNIAMTRLAFGLDKWTNRDYSGTAPLTEAALRHEADTFTNARLWDYRPLADDAGPAPDRPPVLRLLGRGHGPLHGRRRAAPGDALGPRAGDREEPAGDQLGQPAGHLHPRHRHGDGPRERGDPGGPAAASGSRTCRRSRSGAPEITQPRIYFGETRRPLRRGRRRARRSSTTRGGPGRPPSTRPRAGPGRPASRSTRRSRGCCSRSGSRTWTC